MKIDPRRAETSRWALPGGLATNGGRAPVATFGGGRPRSNVPFGVSLASRASQSLETPTSRFSSSVVVPAGAVPLRLQWPVEAAPVYVAEDIVGGTGSVSVTVVALSVAGVAKPVL